MPSENNNVQVAVVMILVVSSAEWSVSSVGAERSKQPAKGVWARSVRGRRVADVVVVFTIDPPPLHLSAALDPARMPLHSTISPAC